MKKDLNINFAMKEVHHGIVTKQEFLLRNPEITEEDWYKFSKGHEFMIENYDEKYYFSVEKIDGILKGKFKNE